MKYQSSNTKLIYDLDFPKNGRYVCPECANGRSKKSQKDLQYYENTKTAFCFHCDVTLFEYRQHEKVDYIIPEWKNITKLSDKAVKWFASRMINQKTLNKLKVYTDNEFMPQFKKDTEVICFPYFINEKLINIKYRGAKKSFKLVSGSELIWYNFDEILNNKEIVICEGEMDLLSFIECGINNVISVPNGANLKLEFLDSSIHHFDKIEKIYIASDNDTKGVELRDELIRRFGPEKCYIVNFKQYKDANAYLMNEGGLEFPNLIKNAKPVPISGAVKIDSIYSEITDLYENGVKEGCNIDFNEIDKYCTWELGRLCMVTGRPSSGKSEFVDFIISKLNLKYGWKAAYFTPENYPLKYHYAKLHEKFSGSKFKKQFDKTNFLSIYEHIKSNFYYILDEDDLTLDSILRTAKSYIKQNGIKILVIDPYNVMEHNIKNGITETRYIGTFLDKLIKFTRFNNILTFLIAHPTKLDKGEIPTLYNISGSAHFYNKTDYGFTVNRQQNSDGLMSSDIDIYWQKIKFKHLGEQGKSELRYNYNNGRFEIRDTIDTWDNSDWLVSEKLQKVEQFENKVNENIPF